MGSPPRNVHYVFATIEPSPEYDAFMRAAVDEYLPNASPEWRTQWAKRVHIVTVPLNQTNTWIPAATQAIGNEFAVDRFQRLRDVGMTIQQEPIRGRTLYSPWLIANEARSFNFEFEREQRLAAEPARVIRVLEQQPLPGIENAQRADAIIPLPTVGDLAAYDTLEVDLLDDCASHKRCPTGQIFLSRCQAGADGGIGCDEFARWTSGRRGRWVTDISSMLPLVAADADGNGRFRLETGSGAQAIVSLSFRLLNRGKGSHAATAIPLWKGGTLGTPEYDALHQPIGFDVSGNASKVELYTLLSVHGGSFLNGHRHAFEVNGTSFVRAPNNKPCSQYDGLGLVPNQGENIAPFGCSGFEVTPEVTDVSSVVRRGARNVISYQALPTTMAPSSEPERVVLASWLVVWR